MPPKKDTKGSVSAEDTPCPLGKKDLDDMVKRAVDAAMASLTKDMAKYTDDQVLVISKEQAELKSENETLKQKVSDLENTVKSMQDKIDDQLTLLGTLEKKVQDSLIWSNRNEQHSRRNNIKILGIDIQPGVDARVEVSKLIDDKLKMKLKDGDITIAHKLPTRPRVATPENPTPQQPRPQVVVQFSRRAVRDEVIRRRKQLKDSNFVIYEDLTSMNLKLINRLENSKLFESVWSWNGKIFGLPTSGIKKKIMFELFCDINSTIQEAAKS